MFPYWVFYSLLAASCLYALLRGGPPERIGAGIFAISALLSTAAVSAHPIRYISIEVGVLAVDLAMLAALLALALRAERFWPLWVSALHIIGTAGHAVKAFDPEVLRLGYAFAMAFWSYPMLLLLVAGTWCHRKRLKRNGADISWSSSFARSETRPRGRPTASSTSSAA
jgi:hypothetical protein